MKLNASQLAAVNSTASRILVVAANDKVKRVPAPLGLSEWQCTDGKTYYNRQSADAHQNGIDKTPSI